MQCPYLCFQILFFILFSYFGHLTDEISSFFAAFCAIKSWDLAGGEKSVKKMTFLLSGWCQYVWVINPVYYLRSDHTKNKSGAFGIVWQWSNLCSLLFKDTVWCTAVV